MSKEQTYIVFLRGVTPTGKNKVPMAELRTALADAGFGDVKTWIQSGNAIVKTELSREETAEFVHRTIREKIGPDLPIIVKTAEELKAVLEENPFLHLAQDRIFYGLTNEEYSDESIERVLGSNYGEDQISFTDHAIYLYIPGNAGQSKLNNSNLERKLKIRLTIRNRNTLSKMIEMAQEDE